MYSGWPTLVLLEQQGVLQVTETPTTKAQLQAAIPAAMGASCSAARAQKNQAKLKAASAMLPPLTPTKLPTTAKAMNRVAMAAR